MTRRGPLYCVDVRRTRGHLSKTHVTLPATCRLNNPARSVGVATAIGDNPMGARVRNRGPQGHRLPISGTGLCEHPSLLFSKSNNNSLIELRSDRV